VLLSRALGHLTARLEAIDGAGADLPSLAVWSNVLRCVAEAGPEGMNERALAPAARISSRLATAAVTGAVRRGWLSVRPGTETRNRRQVELTHAGRVAADVWPARLTGLDAEWRGSPMRTVLEELVAQLPFELPHFPASYGSADPSAVGGSFVPPSSADGVPAHGQDWTPVGRADGDTVSSLPLTALLSQALMAFTIDYESRFPWPLASTTTVLCHLDAQPRPLADVPEVRGHHGIKGNGKTLLERHLIAVVTRDPADTRRKLVALTDRGVLVMQHHPTRLEAVESMWRGRYGDAVVTHLRDALGPLASAASPAMPDHVLAPLDQD
jgi:DNA-binding MarR family transcriptional regulator